MYDYRIIVGEVGNTQGHVIHLRTVRTDIGARRALTRHLREYGGDGWGRVEWRLRGQDDAMWRSL